MYPVDSLLKCVFAPSGNEARRGRIRNGQQGKSLCRSGFGKNPPVIPRTTAVVGTPYQTTTRGNATCGRKDVCSSGGGLSCLISSADRRPPPEELTSFVHCWPYVPGWLVWEGRGQQVAFGGWRVGSSKNNYGAAVSASSLPLATVPRQMFTLLTR